MGVLIRSDIVVTDANYLVDPPNIWNDTGSVRTIDPGRIRVVWINPSGRRLMSQIVSVDVRERDRDSYTTTRTFDVAVLRLKTPFKTSTRICSNLLDETNLPSLKRYQMGVTESWQVSLLDFQSSIEAVPYVNYRSDRCLFMTTRIPQVYITPDRFCTGPVQVSNLTRVGAGFFVRKRDSWFLHGILSFNFWKDDFGKDDSLRWVITDLNDDGVKLWLREKIATKSSDQGVPTTARKLNKCGQADSSLRGLTPGRSQLGHMSWSVLVYFKKAGRKADMFPGVLVRDDVIITDGSQFFAIANETHSSIDSRTVFVIWVSPSGRRKTCEVAAVYVPGEETQNGMALLRLRTPFLESIPACLDIWNDTSVFDIAMGGVGVIEIENNDDKYMRGDPLMYPYYITTVNQESNEQCLPDKFCVGQDSPKPGTGFMTLIGDSWYLRGIYYSGRNVTDLANVSVRTWVQKTFKAIVQDSTPFSI
ncbi:uncharacterized protein LOC113211999 [Frankliniella occidentalis]|uniref:Uncharacterized protein LOC113211999 n=1 Tax=Frankliniella occidentalis TaxID=133901 RepID=A0A9C6X652_FRAOC|nr:uncharacterized protein LOC113211999 [Frankliniella occidentalis]